MGREIAVAGYARLAEGAASRALYEQLTLSAIVDAQTNRIIRADSSVIAMVGQDWLRERLVGTDLLEEPSPFIAAIERDYWGLAGPAIVQAFRDMQRRYRKNLQRERDATGT